MNLALILGKKGSAVKPKLLSIKDNLNIECFNDIPSYLDLAYKQNIIYDRILLLSSVVDIRAIEDLYSYWSDGFNDTSIVLLCRKDVDDAIAKDFVEVFKTTVTSPMMLSDTTVSSVAEAALLPISDIKEKYGYKGVSYVSETDSGISLNNTVGEPVAQEADEQPVEEKVETKEERHKKRREAREKQAKEPKPKKNTGGLLGRIGLGKKVKEESSPEVQIEQPITPIEDTMEQQRRQDLQSFEEFPQNTESTPLIPTEPQFSSSFDEPAVMKNYNPPSDNSIPLEQENTVADFSDGFEESFEDSIKADTQSDGTYADVSDFVDSTDTNSSVVEPFVSPIPLSKPVKNDFQADAEVDEDLSSINISDAESAYRQTTEQPKVITKEVVREVIRNVGTGDSGKVSSILKGTSNAVVIVTGDRGTGVTMTAMNLMHYFSKSVRTLYFDCDVENHGLLNYIDYDDFRSYEPTKLSGVKLCKGLDLFKSCVCYIDNNIDVLTSDFSCDVTNEELKACASVVSELDTEYGVIVVDCPIDKLNLMEDLLHDAYIVVNVEGTKRGFMNLLCRLESLKLPLRYKKTICNKGTLFLTKVLNGTDMNKLRKSITNIYEPEGVNWMGMSGICYNGNLADNIIGLVFNK